MAQEENTQPVKGEKLTYEKLAAYANQLQGRLEYASRQLESLTQELNFYRTQDYYQRAQLLCMILSNDRLDAGFRYKCEEELQDLVFPKEEEKEPAEQPEEK